jgi:ectoine hydroxylase-related dioxygenase (phytanoyl-CoA dioxygenase family)
MPATRDAITNLERDLLHDGYSRITDFVPVEANTAKCVYEECQQMEKVYKFEAIFNSYRFIKDTRNSPTTHKGDGTRKQLVFTEMTPRKRQDLLNLSPQFHALKKKVADRLQPLVPYLNCSMTGDNQAEQSLLHSLVGGKSQPPHQDICDNDWRSNVTSEQRRLGITLDDVKSGCYNRCPLGFLFALGDCSLLVWKRSHHELPAPPVAPFWCSRLELAAGDAVLFRGDFVHAGDRAEKDNYRLHMYLDFTNTRRSSNVTGIIRKQECEEQRIALDFYTEKDGYDNKYWGESSR